MNVSKSTNFEIVSLFMLLVQYIATKDLRYNASLRISGLHILQCFFLPKSETHFKMTVQYETRDYYVRLKQRKKQAFTCEN